MRLRPVQVNLKARDDVALGRFWAAALSWVADSPEPGATSVRPEGAAWPLPTGLTLDVIAVPDAEPAGGRTHIELAAPSATGHAELVARLVQLGAEPLGGARDGSRTMLADPEGNAFCVQAPDPVRADTGPVAAVVVECSGPRALARFWAEAVGLAPLDMSDDRVLLRSPAGAGPCLELVATSHLGGRRSSAHLDLLARPVEAQRAEAERLARIGATTADIGQGDVPWRVLADPEGNLFCILGRG
ncbi:VOC family protein [Motilibacter aurantiacus]|uniref:VOC family protein n=1 Tax=Motilibacter aurantiacus TaxID=2714955 RepID=UPI00140DCC9E|nr:VOC family protein [Motilibacter aurantiacus]NHC46992.1 VOC family protein [Motilibacter aurantiacus]